MSKSVFKIAAVVVVLGAGVWIAAQVQQSLFNSTAVSAMDENAVEGREQAPQNSSAEAVTAEFAEFPGEQIQFAADAQQEFPFDGAAGLSEPEFAESRSTGSADFSQYPADQPFPEVTATARSGGAAAESGGGDFLFEVPEESPTAVQPISFSADEAVPLPSAESSAGTASAGDTGVYSFADLPEPIPAVTPDSLNSTEQAPRSNLPPSEFATTFAEQPDTATSAAAPITAPGENAEDPLLQFDPSGTGSRVAASVAPAAEPVETLESFLIADEQLQPSPLPAGTGTTGDADVQRQGRAGFAELVPPTADPLRNPTTTGRAADPLFLEPSTLPAASGTGSRGSSAAARTADAIDTTPFFPSQGSSAGAAATFGNEEGTVPFPVDAAVGANAGVGQMLPPLDTEAVPALTNGGIQRQVTEEMRPQLTVRKEAPASAIVGVPLNYRIIVTNEGDAAAFDLVIEDELTTAAELIQALPVPDQTGERGVVSWTIAELRAGETKEFQVQVRPTGEGTLNGTATVRFNAQVRSATVVRAPRLVLEILGPPEVRVGDRVGLQFRIHNQGTGDATGVVLHSILPPGLRHPEGSDLEYEMAVLPAGHTETVDLQVIAAEPGDQVRIAAEVTGEGISTKMAKADLLVVGAQLQVQRLGPDRRYVGRAASFQNVVVNETSFPAEGAEVIETVPAGMRVVSIGQDGQYSKTSRQIRWRLPLIEPGAQTVLDVELIPDVAGRMESAIEVVESAGFRSLAEDNTVVMVEGLHNVTADISRVNAPVAIGERFGFTVTVNNRGTATARNVRVALQVPQGIRVLAAGTRDVPGELLSGNVVRYITVPLIRPNEKFDFQITLQGQESLRNAVVRAQLRYDEMETPLVISESVTVFDDAL